MVLVDIKNRDTVIPKIDVFELARAWAAVSKDAGDSFNSAKSVGPIWENALPKVNVLGSKYLDHFIKPNITKRACFNEALSWFAEHFLSGALLGMRLDLLILKALRG